MSHLPGSWGGFGNQSVKYKPNKLSGVLNETPLDTGASSGGGDLAAAPQAREVLQDSTMAHTFEKRRRASRQYKASKDRPSRPVHSLAAKLAAATAGVDSVLANLSRDSATNQAKEPFSFGSALVLSLPTVCMVVGSAKR